MKTVSLVLGYPRLDFKINAALRGHLQAATMSPTNLGRSSAPSSGGAPATTVRRSSPS